MFFGEYGGPGVLCYHALTHPLGLATNIIVSSMLILGGSATVTDLTGMHTIAVRSPGYCACPYFDISHARPASSFRLVSPFTSLSVGCGPLSSVTSAFRLCLSASPIAHPMLSTHTTVLFAIILAFVFTVYSTSPKIGSISAMHDLLTQAAESAPVEGNAQGSYLTMRSKNGLIFGVINTVGNFATVFQDQVCPIRSDHTQLSLTSI